MDKSYHQRYYQKHKKRMLISQREYYKNNKIKANKAKKRWKLNNPEKLKEYSERGRRKYKIKHSKEIKEINKKVNHLMIDYYNKKDISKAPLHIKRLLAIRLAHNRIKITNESFCAKCRRKTPEVKLEKHHPNYNFPLKVKILCKECHMKIKKKEKKNSNLIPCLPQIFIKFFFNFRQFFFLKLLGFHFMVTDFVF